MLYLHFVLGGEVDPELQAPGGAGGGGHLGVHDAAAGRHPLHVAGLDRAAVALEVLVRHGSLQRRLRSFTSANLCHRFLVQNCRFLIGPTFIHTTSI